MTWLKEFIFGVDWDEYLWRYEYCIGVDLAIPGSKDYSAFTYMRRDKHTGVLEVMDTVFLPALTKSQFTEFVATFGGE